MCMLWSPSVPKFHESWYQVKESMPDSFTAAASCSAYSLLLM